MLVSSVARLIYSLVPSQAVVSLSSWTSLSTSTVSTSYRWTPRLGRGSSACVTRSGTAGCLRCTWWRGILAWELDKYSFVGNLPTFTGKRSRPVSNSRSWLNNHNSQGSLYSVACANQIKKFAIGFISTEIIMFDVQRKISGKIFKCAMLSCFSSSFQ